MNPDPCIECGEPAEWLRCTQFAGDHPYCDKCARKETDFEKKDSCTYWTTVEAENKREREQAQAKKAAGSEIKVSKLKFLGHPLFEAPATPERSHYFAALPDGHVIRLDSDHRGWLATFAGDDFRVDALADSPEEALISLESKTWRALEQLQDLRKRNP